MKDSSGCSLDVWLFMIACAARPSEALHARRSEIDCAKRLWTVPKARMKSEREHIVPLSALALEVLSGGRSRTGDVVFPGLVGQSGRLQQFRQSALKARPRSRGAAFVEKRFQRLVPQRRSHQS